VKGPKVLKVIRRKRVRSNLFEFYLDEVYFFGMKKLVFVVLSTLILVSCSLPWQKVGDKIDSMTVSVGADYYFILVPDYEGRLLAVDFNGDDKGTVGGEFFDQFEEIVYFIQNDYEDGRGVLHATAQDKTGFVLEFSDSSKNIFVDYSWDEEIDHMNDIVVFYTHVAELFSEDTY